MISLKDYVEKHFHSFKTQSSVLNVGHYNINSLRDIYIFANYNPSSIKYTTKQNINSVEFILEESRLRPSIKNIDLVGFPINAEIIAIKCTQFGEIYYFSVIFSKEDEESFFQVYITRDIDSIGEIYFEKKLNILPIVIQNTFFFPCETNPDIMKPAFLVTGQNLASDMNEEDDDEDCSFKRIKLFVPDENGLCELNDNEIKQYFPEFMLCSSIGLILSFNSLINAEKMVRTSAFGTVEGTFIVAQVDLKSSNVRKFKYSHNSIIVDLKLIQSPINDQINLCVLNSVEPCVIYLNVSNAMFDNDENKMRANHPKQLTLRESDQYDCVTSMTFCDIDYDGEDEILIGTFSANLLCYKLQSNKTYKLIDKRKVHGPIHKIVCLYLFNDGTKSLVVMTNRGLHIFQLNITTLFKIMNVQLDEMIQLPEKNPILT